jgi:hypothetical protein
MKSYNQGYKNPFKRGTDDWLAYEMGPQKEFEYFNK